MIVALLSSGMNRSGRIWPHSVSNTAAVPCWRSSITLTPNTDTRFTRPMSQHTRPHPAVSQDQFRASGLCSAAPDCFSFIWESSLLPPLQGQNVEWICLLQHMEEIHQIGKNMKVFFSSDLWRGGTTSLISCYPSSLRSDDQNQTYCIWWANHYRKNKENDLGVFCCLSKQQSQFYFC